MATRLDPGRIYRQRMRALLVSAQIDDDGARFLLDRALNLWTDGGNVKVVTSEERAHDLDAPVCHLYGPISRSEVGGNDVQVDQIGIDAALVQRDSIVERNLGLAAAKAPRKDCDLG
jgi:hypothetical protein